MNRFLIDVHEFHQNPVDGIVMTGYDEVESSYVNVCVNGPPDTPYAGGMFEFTIHAPVDYPFRAPKVQMITPVWHPNISLSGKVCLNVLAPWFPATSLLELAEAVRSLLCFPNPDSPLNTDAAWMMDITPDVYSSTASVWCTYFALGTAQLPDYEEKIQQVAEILGWSKERSVKALSARQWSVEDTVRSNQRRACNN